MAARPIFVAIMKNQEVVAFASFFKQDVKFHIFRSVLTMGVIREFIISPTKIAQLGLNYAKIRTFLRLALENAMIREGCQTLLISLTHSDVELRKYLRKIGYGNMKTSIIMLKSLGPTLPKIEDQQKPFKLSAGEAFLFP